MSAQYTVMQLVRMQQQPKQQNQSVEAIPPDAITTGVSTIMNLFNRMKKMCEQIAQILLQ